MGKKGGRESCQLRGPHDRQNRELGVFVYDELPGPQSEFMTFRVLPLGLETPGIAE